MVSFHSPRIGLWDPFQWPFHGLQVEVILATSDPGMILQSRNQRVFSMPTPSFLVSICYFFWESKRSKRVCTFYMPNIPIYRRWLNGLFFFVKGLAVLVFGCAFMVIFQKKSRFDIYPNSLNPSHWNTRPSVHDTPKGFFVSWKKTSSETLELLHPWKLTWLWKSPIFNRKYIFKWWTMLVFRCVPFVSLSWERSSKISRVTTHHWTRFCWKGAGEVQGLFFRENWTASWNQPFKKKNKAQLCTLDVKESNSRFPPKSAFRQRLRWPPSHLFWGVAGFSKRSIVIQNLGRENHI